MMKLTTLLVAVVACSSRSEPKPVAGSGSGSAAPVTGITALGCVREVRRDPVAIPADRKIKVGVLLREDDLEAKPMRNGAVLAAEEWNKVGGVLGKHPIEVVYYDEGATKDTGLAAVKRALAEGVDVVIGGRNATGGASYVEAVMDAGKFLFLTTTGPPDAPKKWVTAWDRYKTYFHLDPVAGFQFEPGTARSFLPKVEEHFLAVETGALLAYIKKTWGFDRIAFVREDEGLFQKMTGVFEKAAQSRGWTVTGTEVVGPKTDFAALWKKLRDNKTQFVRFILRDGINFAKTYGQVKPPILAFGNLDGGTTKEFWKQTDGGAEGIIFHHKGAADVPMHYHSSWWQKQYQERFADYPTTLGDDVYVAIHGFARAIETVKTLDPELVAVTLEKLEFPVGPGYFGWYPDSLGSCHIRGADRMRAVWSSQWHPGGKLVPVWNEALHGERDGFPLAQRYFVQGNLRFPHGLEPQPPK